MKATLFVIVTTLFFITGCVRTNTGTVAAKFPTTGSEVTGIWKDYDIISQEEDKPELNFVSTSQGVKKENKITKPVDFTDFFTHKDDNVYIFTKWLNVEKKPKYEAKIYEPGGKLFQIHKAKYKYSSGKWNLWTRLKVRGFPASELPGLWTAEIYMDSVIAYVKQFEIQSSPRFSKAAFPYGTVGVLTFHDSGVSISNRKHYWSAARYLAQKLIVRTNAKVILPKILYDDISRPVLEKDNYFKWIEDDLASSRSSVMKLMERHNLDAIVTGTVVDNGEYGHAKRIVTYVIDRRSKTVRKVAASYYTSNRSFDTSARDIRMHLYQRMFDDFIKKI